MKNRSKFLLLFVHHHHHDRVLANDFNFSIASPHIKQFKQKKNRTAYLSIRHTYIQREKERTCIEK